MVLYMVFKMFSTSLMIVMEVNGCSEELCLRRLVFVKCAVFATLHCTCVNPTGNVVHVACMLHTLYMHT